ncbi:uncharacterized protein LOC117182333 isoform X2 [Belonocnema kinseyi]|uniref:uncharacterized protein LOC117182333 isoform X2 n=1 Tax=Belonocnema kinseyi TaxID=2817044 RepID=UPI00143E0538|nr:uncharacterized protein LOC117182333 isoform X2 [Belonocnema kinseyi]
MTDSEDSMNEPDRKFNKLLEKTLSDPYVKKDREEEEEKLSKMLRKKVKKEKAIRKVWNRSPIFKGIHKRIQEGQEIKNIALLPEFLKPSISISKIISFGPHLIKRKEKRKNSQDQSVWIYKSESRRQCVIADKLRSRKIYESRQTFSKERDKLFWHPSWNISAETICGADLQKSRSDVNSFVSTRKRKVPRSEIVKKKSHKKVANQDLLETFRTNMDVTPPIESFLFHQESYSSIKETTNPEINSLAEMSSTQSKPGPRILSNKPARPSLTKEILKRVRNQRALNLLESSKYDDKPNRKSQLTEYSKSNSTDSISEINTSDEFLNLVAETNFVTQRRKYHSFKDSNMDATPPSLASMDVSLLKSSKDYNEQNRESRRTEYSKSNSTDSISEIRTSEEFLSLANETNFVTQRRKFQPLKSSTLISPTEIALENFSSRKRVFSCELESSDKSKNASHILSEEVNIDGKSSRKKFDSLKNESSFEGNKSMLDLTNFENIKAGSPILSRGKNVRKRKQNQFLEENKFVNISTKIGKPLKIRKMSLQENAEGNKQVEISENLIVELDTTLKKFTGIFDRSILKKALESYIQKEFDHS